MNNFWCTVGDIVVVKVWSNVISCPDNHVNIDNLKYIVTWVQYLMEQWLHVVLVSSGAIAVWRSIYTSGLYNNQAVHNKTIEKAQFSRLWWHALLSIYKGLFDGRLAIDSLLTHKNFSDKNEFTHLHMLMKANMQLGIVNILNENDSVSDEELWFSDNDELAWLVAEHLDAKVIILLTDQDGVCRDFWTKSESLIAHVSSVDDV